MLPIVINVDSEEDYQRIVPILSKGSFNPPRTFGHKGEPEYSEVHELGVGWSLVIITSDHDQFLRHLEGRSDLIVLVWRFKESEGTKEMTQIANLVQSMDMEEQKQYAQILGAPTPVDLANKLFRYKRQTENEVKIAKLLERLPVPLEQVDRSDLSNFIAK